MKYSLENIKRVMAAKGYKFFEAGQYNLNIIGIRANSKQSDSFDDEIHFIFRDENSRVTQYYFPCTTDPGLDYLNNPLSSKGTAILVPGQYAGMWAIGMHGTKNPYEALVQINPVKVYRDNDRDAEFDFIQQSIDMGVFGINMHHANFLGETERVGKWSAGCQVFKNIKDFEFAMSIVRKSAAMYGNKFTYTLLEEKDFQL